MKPLSLTIQKLQQILNVLLQTDKQRQTNRQVKNFNYAVDLLMQRHKI